MAHCTDIEPLLSAYNDGELTPLEVEQVTQHLDNCGGCKETLLDYVLLGHHLRTAVPMPSLDGFAQGVIGALPQVRRPLSQRLRDWREALLERWVAAVSLAGAAVALASLTLVLFQPHALTDIAGTLVHRANRGEIAQNQNQTNQEIAQNQNQAAASAAAPQAESSNSQTFISRLEARHPSVAMWSEPDYKTTVIWLGDDASGND